MPEDFFRFTEHPRPRETQADSKDTQELLQRYQQVDRLRQSVREGNEYAACLVMEERFRSMPAGRLEDRLTELKYDLVLLSGQMCQSLREAGVEIFHLDRVFTESIQSIERLDDPAGCAALAEKIARDFCGLSRLKSFQQYPPLVKEIILTVDMDLARPLTLNYFAEKLNVNSSYLSGLFKRETGMSVTEYVTIRRMVRAADLLSTSQLPIKTIAKQVGIADVHYFSRVFKKKTGQTPRHYRESSSV